MAIPALPGVTIGGYHCWNDWHCTLANKTIGYPEIVRHQVAVPGRDGYVDFTPYLLGRSAYRNRKIKIRLLYKAKYDRWPQILDHISFNLHGKYKDIVFDDDPNWIYRGRCSVSCSGIDKWSCYVDIEVDADPFKLAKNERVETSIQFINTSVWQSRYDATINVERGAFYTFEFQLNNPQSSVYGEVSLFAINGNMDKTMSYIDTKFTLRGETVYNFGGQVVQADANGQLYIAVKTKDYNASGQTFTMKVREARL